MFDITTPSPITTAVRDAMKGIGGILGALGVVNGDTWTTITGVVMFVVPAAYAIWKQVRMANTA